ncbi:MAG: EamA family transporter, partial [Natronospirillum sp.]
FSLGRLPWVSLALASSFGFYGLVRKRTPVDTLNGLTVETLVLLPMAMLWLGWLMFSPTMSLALGSTPGTTVLLITSGILTAIPLLLFASAAQRLDLSVLGFIMYINPTMQFLIALFIFQEEFPPQRLVTFVLVWIALILFMWGMWTGRKRPATP